MVRRNPSKVIFNTDLPFLSSRPDVFVYGGQGELKAIIEVKYRVDPRGEILKKGSQTYTQMIVQMLTSKVDVAYLAVTADLKAYTITKLELNKEEAQLVVYNLLKAYVPTMQSLISRSSSWHRK